MTYQAAPRGPSASPPPGSPPKASREASTLHPHRGVYQDVPGSLAGDRPTGQQGTTRQDYAYQAVSRRGGSKLSPTTGMSFTCPGTTDITSLLAAFSIRPEPAT